jgi:hypothetical protein
MTEELFVKWPRNVRDRIPVAFLKKQGMFTLDAFKGHLTEKVYFRIQKVKTNFQSEHRSSDHTRFLIRNLTNHSKSGCITRMGKGSYLELPTNIRRKHKTSEIQVWQ